MKFREVLNENEEEAVASKPLVPVRQKFKEDVLGEKELDERRMPPGFSKDDTESTSEFVKTAKQTSKEEMEEDKKVMEKYQEIDEAVDDAEVSDIDIEALKKKKLDIEAGKDKPEKLDIAARPSKMLHTSNIVDDDGKEIDTDELMAKMSVRPAKLIGQNKKLAKSGSNQTFYDLTLPAYQGLYVDEKAKEIKVVKTCPSAGECKRFCYAAKGGYVMFPASSLNASRVVTFLMNDYEGFKTQLLKELADAVKSQGKKGNTVVLRWHDAGDFISEKYMKMAFDIAKATPEVEHYAYTKQVPMVKKLEAEKPKNFLFRFSFGGTHDEEISAKKDKYSKVVPTSLFNDIPHTKTKEAIVFDKKAVETLKERIAKEYKLDIDTIKTYDEVMKIPVGNKLKWNVLVWKGHGDTAAARNDVQGVFLFFH